MPMRRTAAFLLLFLLSLQPLPREAGAEDSAVTPPPEAAETAAPEPSAQDNGIAPLPAVPALVASERATFRIAAVGDIMMGTTFPEDILPPKDGATLFRDVRPLLEGGDLVFGNLEGALAEGGKSPKCGDYKPGPGVRPCFAFRTPPRYAEHLRETGFNILNVANNHTLDFGMEGMDNTLSALDNARITQAVGDLFPRGLGVFRRCVGHGLGFIRTGPDVKGSRRASGVAGPV